MSIRIYVTFLTEMPRHMELQPQFECVSQSAWGGKCWISKLDHGPTRRKHFPKQMGYSHLGGGAWRSTGSWPRVWPAESWFHAVSSSTQYPTLPPSLRHPPDSAALSNTSLPYLEKQALTPCSVPVVFSSWPQPHSVGNKVLSRCFNFACLSGLSCTFSRTATSPPRQLC